jgi:hypothetical protein
MNSVVKYFNEESRKLYIYHNRAIAAIIYILFALRLLLKGIAIPLLLLLY